MDGGSDDNTVEILEKYDPWIDHWVSEPDDGQAQAINDGLSTATGDIRAYLNSDDYYFPGVFAHVAQTFRRSDAILLCGTVETSEGELRHPPASEDLGDWIQRTVSFPQPGCFWRQTEAIPSFDSSLECTFDRKFFMQLLLRSVEIVRSDVLVAQYRVHPDAKTSTLSFREENRRVDRDIVQEADARQRDQLQKSIKIREARRRLHSETDTLGELLRIAQKCPQMLQRREFYGHMRRLVSQVLFGKTA
jgi:glycosyltransferase involved in cell wall biosynthesis